MEQGIVIPVPEILAALAKAWRQAAAGLQVLDGPLAAQALADDFGIVGTGNEDNAAGVEVDISQEASGLRPKPVATLTVRCAASTWSGDTDILGRYRRLNEIIGALDLALREDPHLDDTVDIANLGRSLRYYPGQTTDGAVVNAEFDVELTVYV